MATEKAVPVGGLTNSKLALATATEADVLSGKTFYSGNKEMKTGTAVTSCSNTHSFNINQTNTINCGFRPEKIVVVIKYSGQTIVLEYDNSNPNVLIESTLGSRTEQNNNTYSVRIKTTENGFTYWTSNYAYIGYHCTSYAMR